MFFVDAVAVATVGLAGGQLLALFGADVGSSASQGLEPSAEAHLQRAPADLWVLQFCTDLLLVLSWLFLHEPERRRQLGGAELCLDKAPDEVRPADKKNQSLSQSLVFLLCRMADKEQKEVEEMQAKLHCMWW